MSGPAATGAGTQRLRDGTGWQDVGGYSRAVRRGPLVAVSGTTAHGPDGAALFPGDTYGQARHCLGVVLAAVEALGGTRDDVVRTRVLLAPGADWEAATRAHGEVFGAAPPANSTYYVAGLVGDGFLVEVEAEAFVGPGTGPAAAAGTAPG
nr:Rid family hydrolase [Kineosporia sp. A_224]